MTMLISAPFANAEIIRPHAAPAKLATSVIGAVAAHHLYVSRSVSLQAALGFTARGNPAVAIVAQFRIPCAVFVASLTPDCPSLRLSHSNRALFLQGPLNA